jgi:hypothetical protein
MLLLDVRNVLQFYILVVDEALASIAISLHGEAWCRSSVAYRILCYKDEHLLIYGAIRNYFFAIPLQNISNPRVRYRSAPEGSDAMNRIVVWAEVSMLAEMNSNGMSRRMC